MEEKLKELLMEEARKKGICICGYKEMCKNGIDGLVDFYMRTLDWSLERSFPDLQTLEEYFSRQEGKGVFVKKTFHGETFSELQAYVFHACKGTINVEMDYDNAVIPMLYFANGCDMRVVCNQGNPKPIRVPLYMFGENSVSADGMGNAEFKRYDFELA